MSFGNLKNKLHKLSFQPKRSLPIAAKVTLWYTTFISLILLVLILFSLRATAVILRSSNENHLIKKVTEKVFDPKTFESVEDGIFFSVIEDGEVIAGSYPRHFDGSIPLSSGAVTSLFFRGEEFLYYDVQIQSRPTARWIRGVLPISRSMANIKTISLALILLSPLVLFIIALGGYRIIKRGFLPIKKLSESAREIEESKDFSRRLYVGKTQDELHAMSLVLNNMLSSLEQTYLREKQFSNDVSHELRTPVSVILSESDYGIHYLENLEEAKESFEVIHRQSQRMSSMIRSILELSKIDHLQHLSMEHIHLDQIMNKLLEEFRPLCQERNIQLHVFFEENLSFYGSSLFFERLMDNLLSNALKFTKDCIDVSWFQRPEGLQIAVKDNGIGMKEEELQQIWSRFYQADASRNKKDNPGIGLGLSLVDKIARLQGWQIQVESTLLKGSTFTLLIPLSSQSEENQDSEETSIKRRT